MKTLHKPLLNLLRIFIISFFALTACENADTKNVDPPPGVISPKQAMMLSSNYTNTRYKIINRYLGSAVSTDSLRTIRQDTVNGMGGDGKGFMDNRSSWWSIEDMEAYIAYAKSEAKQKGYTLDGLRIYQGAYPDSVAGGKKRIGLGTVFIVPTGKKEVTQQGAMYPIIMLQKGSSDLKELAVLNTGHNGNPPQAIYPQN